MVGVGLELGLGLGLASGVGSGFASGVGSGLDGGGEHSGVRRVGARQHRAQDGPGRLAGGG